MQKGGVNMTDKGTIFTKLMHLATSNGIIVRFAPL